MKKILLTLVLLGLMVSPTFSAIAQFEETPGEVGREATGDVMTVLDRVVDWLFYILLFVAAVFIIIAAYYFVTASGDPETVKKARTLILYAIIGIVVAFVARGLVFLVERMIGSPEVGPGI